MHALTFNTFGGSNVLSYQEIPRPTLKEGEVLIEMKAIGLNFADIYRRNGNYHLEGTPPYVLGYEGAGIVAEASAASPFAIGDRVAFADVPNANAEFVAAPIEKVIPLPEGISFDTGASLLLQGLTAHYLTRDSYQIRPRDIALVHAAAGGVGQLLTQMILLQGGSVIGLTSSKEKAAVAKANGCLDVYLYDEDWRERVLSKTNGRGVDVVYESVGSTILDSFATTRTGGTVVFYGMAGGDPVAIDPRMLMDTSKTLTGGDLWNVLTSREERIRRSGELFAWALSGQLSLETPTVFDLKDGALAHDLLESRKSTGKILLHP